MLTIDAQVHAYERNHPGRPWVNALPGPPEVTGADMVAAMDTVGVDGAILVSPFMLYRYDPSYAVEVRDAYPERFALVTPVDPSRDDAAEVIAEWAATPGAVGIRLMGSSAGQPAIEDPAVSRVMVAAARHSLPICMVCWGPMSLVSLPIVGQLAASHPDTQLVIDHLGLPQEMPQGIQAREPFAGLHALLDLARHPNVTVKVTGAVAMSHQPFPFDDLREPLGSLFEVFGFDRCMWGTDWTRTTVSYADAVSAFRDTDWLSADECRALMGGTLQQVFGWAPVTSLGNRDGRGT